LRLTVIDDLPWRQQYIDETSRNRLMSVAVYGLLSRLINVVELVRHQAAENLGDYRVNTAESRR
jgi:hypothetical protein